MKIVLVSSYYETSIGGGSAGVVNSLSRNLNDLGHEVIVITTQAAKNLSESNEKGIKIYRFLPKNLYWIGNKDEQPIWKKVLWQLFDIWNPHSYRVVKKILDQEKPDLVHVHKIRGLSPSVWTAAKKAGIKNIIHTCHDNELFSPEGTLLTSIGKMAQNKHWLFRPYQKFRAYFSKDIIFATAPSNFTLNINTRTGFFTNAKKRVIPNTHGFTEEELSTREYPINKSDPAIQFLFIGRLEKTKGVEFLCATFDTTTQIHSNIRLDVVGWGPLLSKLQNDFDNHPNIQIHGPAFGDKKREFFEKSDVVIVPSIWPEPFGIVILEAFSYGKPVVASEIGGMPELIKEGKTGFLFFPENRKKLTNILGRIAQSPQLVRSMREECLKKSMDYTVEKVTNQYLELYQQF